MHLNTLAYCQPSGSVLPETSNSHSERSGEGFSVR